MVLVTARRDGTAPARLDWSAAAVVLETAHAAARNARTKLEVVPILEASNESGQRPNAAGIPS